MSKKVKDFEEYLNELYDVETVLEKTEHCWAGNDKTKNQQKKAKNLALQGKYGTILRRYDQIAFNVELQNWRRT